MNRVTRFAAAVLVAACIAVPGFAQRGDANFTRFVALGDSYGAGFSSGSLNERHQVWSWPAVIARQVGLELCAINAAANEPCFAQPLVSYPGIAAELQLNSLTVGPVPGSGLGTPLMTTFARPYNNLAVPGATLAALLGVTGAEPQQPGQPTPVTFGRFILRGLGNQIQQAVAQQPTFIAMWVGGNDVLGAAFAGTPTALTPPDVFKQRYEAILDQLIAGAPGAGMVVGNLPANIPPYFTLVPPFIVDPVTRQPFLVNGQPIYYLAQLSATEFGPLPPGSLVLPDARTEIARGVGLPNFLSTVPPFEKLPAVGQPLPDRFVLTPAEQQALIARVGEYNTIIQTAAAQRQIPVADINSVFQRYATATGTNVGPINVNGAFISGGFFSYDGFHLTDLGYLLFANEYIRTINEAYETEIPVASITQLYANNGGFFPESSANRVSAQFADGVAENLSRMFAPPTLRKMRVTGHGRSHGTIELERNWELEEN